MKPSRLLPLIVPAMFGVWTFLELNSLIEHFNPTRDGRLFIPSNFNYRTHMRVAAGFGLSFIFSTVLFGTYVVKQILDESSGKNK